VKGNGIPLVVADPGLSSGRDQNPVAGPGFLNVQKDTYIKACGFLSRGPGPCENKSEAGASEYPDLHRCSCREQKGEDQSWG